MTNRKANLMRGLFVAATVAVAVLAAFTGGRNGLATEGEVPSQGLTLREVVQYEVAGNGIVERWTLLAISEAEAADPKWAVTDEVADAQYRLNAGRWASTSIPVRVYYNNSVSGPGYPDLSGSLLHDLQQWNNAGSAFRFEWGGATRQGASVCESDASWSGLDGFNTITYSSRLQPGVLAQTCTWSSGSGAAIEEFDMVISTGFAWTSVGLGQPGSFDIYSTVLHELGHAAGIAHPNCSIRNDGTGQCSTPDELAAVMYPYLREGEQRRILGTDDRAAIVASYGAASALIEPIPDRRFRNAIAMISRDP